MMLICSEYVALFALPPPQCLFLAPSLLSPPIVLAFATVKLNSLVANASSSTGSSQHQSIFGNDNLHNRCLTFEELHDEEKGKER
jgi:hypothetical protein